MDGFSIEPVRAIIVEEGAGRSDLLEGRLTVDERRLELAVGDRVEGCALEDLQRLITDSLPDALADRFEDGLIVQWQGDDRRRRAIVEMDTATVDRFVRRVGAMALSGRSVRCEQEISPNRIDAATDPQQWGADTELRVDADTGTVAFTASELEALDPATITAVSLTKRATDDGEKPTVRIQTLTVDSHVDARIYAESTATATLLRDLIVYSYERTETGGPISVLLVDDEPALVEIAKMHLRDEHPELSVRFATHTQHAIALIEQDAFECIITDYSMPEGGAPEIIDTIDRQERSVPVIVFSRRDPAKIPESEKPAGVDIWFEKEMGSDQYHRLATAIKQLVAPRRANNRQ